MSDNIFGERFFGHREPAWHGLGTVLNEELSVSQAFEKVGMNYNVVKASLSAIVSVEGAASLLVPTDKFAIVREETPDDPEYRIFGTCSDEYEIIQNADIAKILDPLAEQWKTETVGAIDHGKTIFVTLDAGAAVIKSKDGKKEDPVSKFFLITESKTGGTAMKFAFTPVRVVCQNTLVSGLRAATVSSQLSHRTGLKNEMEWRIRLLADLSKAENIVMNNMQLMAKTVLDDSKAVEIIEAAYPLPKKSAKAQMLMEFDDPEKELSQYTDLLNELTTAQADFEYWINRNQIFRNSATELFKKFNDEHTAFAHTAWSAYNAVVETEDYRNGMKHVQESALFGARAAAKKRAFYKALELSI